VFVDGKRLWSKLEAGTFPVEDELVARIVKLI
jgi:hypothetical protein